ncbi:response regulator [Paracraurococcus ruber]|uniref:Response regulatory domain-containing protein n=1 Tax=Paracraurococcus ruber TaxID=77675 RepID=A0ABS1CYD3_9PROT|nr:response regulator [Paracraurococcus ruber]MBK1659326.1 hypothetical protein [Paracraurococcus ruber]TDG29809.1 response regulator [Paracraurococcus ruber]
MTQTTAMPPATQRKHVILAENEAVMRGVLRSILLQMDLEVMLAADGVEAVRLAAEFPAQLVLLDIAMPHMNGLLACHAIRRMPGYRDVPIVALTAFVDDRMRAAAREVGATDFITKPFRPDVLMARLAGHLRAATPDGAAAGPGARSQAWDIGREATMAAPSSPALAHGRRMLQVWRSLTE